MQWPVGFLFVVGVNSVSSDLMTFRGPELAVRLNSVCPPSAVRPHLQDGVLLGRYQQLKDRSVGSQSPMAGSIPIATIYLRNLYGNFWGNPDFPIHTEESLLPSENRDELLKELRETLTYDRDEQDRLLVRATT
jgi:hypothetical protein